MAYVRLILTASLAWSLSTATVPLAAEEIETGPVPPLRAGLPPAEAFLKAAQYKNLQLSPDGRRLAAIVPINGRANLALVDLEHRKVVALTGEKDDDVYSYRWLGNRVIEARPVLPGWIHDGPGCRKWSTWLCRAPTTTCSGHATPRSRSSWSRNPT